ncbi:MAG: hypothetical protein ACE5JH_11715 [Acidobacteriota bacterium]
MPHVVLEGRISIDDCRRLLGPFLVREGDRIVKGGRLYLERGGREALVETLVVDRGHTQKFFIQLCLRERGLIVRLEPLTDPEKTPGVRRAIAVVAHRIRRGTGCSYGTTNIENELIRGEG